MNNYNANIYLTPNDLNDIEDMIEEITNDVQENIFNNTQSSLRNVQIGDDLSGKTLYLSFPRNCYEDITSSTSTEIINVGANNKIGYVYNNERKYIYTKYNATSYFIYVKKDSDTNPYLNYVRFKLPYDYGVVTQIDSSNVFYQYIKIYDDEKIIPDYVKNQYSINEVPTMRQIDNIENGIKNIGYYYYKPIGFVGTREWLGTAKLGKNNPYGTNMQNISYMDFNRWLTDLQAINFNELDILTLWNTYISEIDWNKQNDTEWEEY